MQKAEYSIMYDLEQTHWWFLGKGYLIRGILERFFPNPHEKVTSLDIGCGTGMILRNLKTFGMAYGLDSSWEAIQFLKRRAKAPILCADANRCLPFKDNTFSIITCLDVLEHLENDRFLLEEIGRVCKKGGLIIITVPAFDFFWSPHDTALHHKRRYTKAGILDKIHALDLRVERISYFNLCLFIPILAVRKIRGLMAGSGNARSDFFIPIPKWVNKGLVFLYRTELRFLKYVNFPFGVSLLFILHKEN